MTTLDSSLTVQLPSRGYAYESIGHLGSYNTSSAFSQDNASQSQVAFAPSRVSDSTSVLASESRHSEAYHRWRPRYHLMPPRGWLNDPCAPAYDAVHDVYHVGFQWNPKKPEWGDISWGAALSKDLLFWDIGSSPSITPSSKHNGEAGVFTGCWSPMTVAPGQSTAFYTSARILPIHHTLPYNWGSEAICIATSPDAGRTWQRRHESTVLQGPPQHLQVTGWRDPFVAEWSSLSRLLGKSSDKALFGVVSGGLRDSGPAVFLYSLDGADLTIWSFISALTITPLPRGVPNSRWELDYGANWEVVNFVSVPDPEDPAISHNVLIIGAEGCKQLPATTSGRYHHSEFRRDHRQMWGSGTLLKGSDGIQMQLRSGGSLDYGAMYAVNSFRDPKSGQQVAFGWVVEEDLPEELRDIQGWAGLLSLPRTIQLKRLHHVVHALKSALTSIKSFDVVPEEMKQQHALAAGRPQTYTITTLCAMPDSRLTQLRQTKYHMGPVTHLSLPGALGSLNFPDGCSCWEIDMSFAIGSDVEDIGFVISHTKGEYSEYSTPYLLASRLTVVGQDSELRTVISFNPEAEMLKIIRAKSTNIGGICVADEEAPHTLFSTLSHKSAVGSEPALTQESLQLHAFFDVSCLELFANDRTAITTRVYPESMTCFSIQPFVTKKDQRPWSGQLSQCTAWELKTSPS